MYLSAIFYPVENLPETMQIVVNWNPVYLQILFARECVMYGHFPEPWVWIRLVIWCVGSLLIGMLVFKSKENKIMQTI
jgi:ABC-type polysaccharide/polyol phosphate export permease